MSRYQRPVDNFFILPKLIQNSADRYYDEHAPKRKPTVDRKQKQEIEEKKQALGIRSGGYDGPQM